MKRLIIIVSALFFILASLIPIGGALAAEWNLKTLHTDMKWCLGLGVRAWAKGIVVRIDTAASEEDVKIQMMVAQPFQF